MGKKYFLKPNFPSRFFFCNQPHFLGKKIFKKKKNFFGCGGEFITFPLSFYCLLDKPKPNFAFLGKTILFMGGGKKTFRLKKKGGIAFLWKLLNPPQ